MSLSKILGAYLGDSSAAENRNFEHIVTKFKQVAKRWCECKLTIPSQITVFKCMILSVAMHILSTTHIGSEHLQTLQKMCNDFVWHGQNHLKERVLQNTMKWGGLAHMHVKHCLHKIRLRWIICLWEDRGKLWSVIVWPKLIADVPECVWPGMTYCTEQIVGSVSPFYCNCAKSFTYLNRLDVHSLRPRNIWGTEAFPQINQSLITLGYIQIGDLPIRDGIIDYRVISMAAQHMGFTENFFLLHAFLQTKLKPYLGCESHPLDFPMHLYT